MGHRQRRPDRLRGRSTTAFTVGAVFGNEDVAGKYLVSRAAWAPHAAQDVDAQVLVALRPGVGLAAGKSAVKAVARPGGSSVLDRDEYIASVAQGVDMFLGIVYVLLLTCEAAVEEAVGLLDDLAAHYLGAHASE